MEVKLDRNERIEDLQCNGLKIIQNKEQYTFTSDSVILANFISTKKEDLCAEIGTGCGVISILLSAKSQFKKISAFELQPQMARLAEKNVILNKLEEKIEIISDEKIEVYKFMLVELEDGMTVKDLIDIYNNAHPQGSSRKFYIRENSVFFWSSSKADKN